MEEKIVSKEQIKKVDLLNPDYDVLIYQSNDCSMLSKYLLLFGFAPTVVTAEDVVAKFKAGTYDLCILDYKNNDSKDLSILKHIRELDSNIPIIFLAGRLVDVTANAACIIEAFKNGIDDYVVRPYSMDELICRMRAVLRRSNKVKSVSGTYKIGDYELDTMRRLLTYNSSFVITLSPSECKILSILCAYLNTYIPKEVLGHSLWDSSANKIKVSRTLAVYLSRIKGYLKFDSRIKIDSLKEMIGLFIDTNAKNESLF